MSYFELPLLPSRFSGMNTVAGSGSTLSGGGSGVGDGLSASVTSPSETAAA
jgi:hypothetical protein